MRDEKYVLTLAAAASVRLNTEVAVVQGDRYTEWRANNKGFAVGPCPTSYPARALLEVIITKLTPPMPAQKPKRTDDEDGDDARSKPAVRATNAQRRKNSVR